MDCKTAPTSTYIGRRTDQREAKMKWMTENTQTTPMLMGHNKEEPHTPHGYARPQVRDWSAHDDLPPLADHNA